MKSIYSEIKKLDFIKSNENSLKQEYVKALKNEEFKELINSLLLDEDHLMKYTTKLQECVTEYHNCKNCKHLFECKNQLEGFCLTPEVDGKRLTFSYNICKYKKKIEKANKYQHNIYYFDIPKEIKEANMADIFTNDKNRLEVIEWLTDFITDYKTGKASKGLYLDGNFGSGKTYLVSAVLNELAKANYKVAAIYWPEFLRDLKASFDVDFKQKYEYIKKAPLLLIDDIGAENSTPWARDEILGPILQFRMQEKLVTFFTSNLTLEELEIHFGSSNYKTEQVKAKRIIERIKQLSQEIKMISKNNRK